MRLRVVGSGGAVPFPKPGCDCKECKKAKGEGAPYERSSSALFVYPNILIDTPEEVFRRMLKLGINDLKHVFFTHWHPDHTQGIRLFELWVRSGFIGKPLKEPINVYLPRDMIPDFDKFVSIIRFFEKQKYVKIIQVEDRKPLKFVETTITPINFRRSDRVRYGFLIEEDSKRVMYAPCSVFGTKFDKFWENLDILFIETGWHGNTENLRKRNVEPWFKDHASLEENLKLLKKLKPKKTILTHLEGSIHQTYDLIKKEAKKYPAVEVAYDGMLIKL